jgi:hypothetical protein
MHRFDPRSFKTNFSTQSCWLGMWLITGAGIANNSPRRLSSRFEACSEIVRPLLQSCFRPDHNSSVDRVDRNISVRRVGCFLVAKCDRNSTLQRCVYGKQKCTVLISYCVLVASSLPEIIMSFGEVTERLKVHDWKSCVLQKSTGGSNPPLSARSV